MRVLHIIPQFPFFAPDTVVGGHASCLYALAMQQGESGHDVTILASGPAGEHELAPRVRLTQLRTPGRRGTKRFAGAWIATMAAWLGTRRRAFDVIHWHSGFVDYVVGARIARAVARRPTMHTLYCPAAPGGGASLRRSVLARCARDVDALGAMSPNVADSVETLGIRRPEVFGACVRLRRFESLPRREATRAKLGLPADAPVFLFVGNTKREKNLHRVLEAFSQLDASASNAHLVVTTELDANLSGELAQAWAKVRRAKMTARVKTLGIVENMPALIDACDVLVAPFAHTHGPSDYFVAALEAMLLGKVVLCSPAGGMAELMRDEMSRLVPADDPRALRDAMHDVVGNADLWRSAATIGPALIRARFASGHVARAYDAAYERIL